MAENAYPYDTAVVRELLKNKRKTRGIRSCFPCRHRKVRCDGREPCSNCVKRGHSELCRVPTASGSEARAPQAAPRDVQGPSVLNLDALYVLLLNSRQLIDFVLEIVQLKKRNLSLQLILAFSSQSWRISRSKFPRSRRTCAQLLRRHPRALIL